MFRHQVQTYHISHLSQNSFLTIRRKHSLFAAWRKRDRGVWTGFFKYTDQWTHSEASVISVTLSSPNSFITSAQRQWYFHKARKYNPISTVLHIAESNPNHLYPQMSSQLIQSLAFAVNEPTWWSPKFDLFLTLYYVIVFHSYINFTDFSSRN